MAFCFDNYSFMTVDFLLLFFLFLTVTANFIGELKINWRLTYETYHVLYIIDFIIALVSLFVIASFICLRDKSRINSTSNRFCIYATYYLFIINTIKFFGLLLTIYKVYLDFVEFGEKYAGKIGKKSDYLFTVGQWGFFLGSMIPNLIFNISIFPMLHSLICRLTGRIVEKSKYKKVGVKSLPNELTDD